MDLGSGSLVDFSALRPAERTDRLRQSSQAGPDLVTFSGDKLLLGGPQSGIIAGRADLVTQNQVQSAQSAPCDVDKMTLAGMAEVLKLYRHPGQPRRSRLPTLRHLTAAR